MKFLFFFKWTADVLAPRLAVVFRRLFRLDSFPVCWTVANVTQILKGPSSSSVVNYRPISLTLYCPRYLRVWCWFVLGGLWNAEVCVKPTSSLVGTVLALVMPFYVWYTPYRVFLILGGRLELLFRSTSDFSGAFDRINHNRQALLCGSWRFCAVCSDTVSL